MEWLLVDKPGELQDLVPVSRCHTTEVAYRVAEAILREDARANKLQNGGLCSHFQDRSKSSGMQAQLLPSTLRSPL